MTEVRLSQAEREETDRLADVYSLLVTTEMLEKAFINGSITADKCVEIHTVNNYTASCNLLIAQFKTLRETLDTPQAPFDFDTFIRQYRLSCQLGYKRLVRDGVPATVLHGAYNQAQDQVDLHLVIARCVEQFVTNMDALRLQIKAVDELHPRVTELMTSLNKLATLPAGVKANVSKWLQRLAGMRAHEELSDQDARQMTMELEQAYVQFNQFLESSKR